VTVVRKLALAAILSGLVFLTACQMRPPFVILTIEDPSNVATGFSQLAIGAVDEALRPANVSSHALPLTITVVGTKSGVQALVAEARDGTGRVLGRGVVTARFANHGTPTAVVQLHPACEAAADCDDGLFCNGMEACSEDGICAAGMPPCVSAVDCAVSTCIEGTGGTGSCSTTLDNGVCPTGSYCDPAGGGCVGSLCGDGYVDTRNGEECDSGADVNPNGGCDGCRRTVWQSEVAVGLGYSEGVATELALTRPEAVAYDSVGRLYVADSSASRVLRIDSGGVPIAIAGTGVGGFSGDGGPATNAQVNWPADIVIDGQQNLLIADTNNSRIRKVCLSVAGCGAIAYGNIDTIAGKGTSACSGDGGPAMAAEMRWPRSIAMDKEGSLLVADTWNHRIRKICWNRSGCGTIAYNNIDTVVGSSACGATIVLEGDFGGDGGPATSALLYWPWDISLDDAGNFLIADYGNNRIRKVCNAASDCGSLLRGDIDTIAGTDAPGDSGDKAPAIQARLSTPNGVALDADNNVIIADTGNSRIRKVCLDALGCGTIAPGNIDTIAGNGNLDYAGDGGAAVDAALAYPSRVALDRDGNLTIADTYNNRIRKVCTGSLGCAGILPGSITTIAGGRLHHPAEGGPANRLRFWGLVSVRVDAQQIAVLTDAFGYRIWGLCLSASGCGPLAYGHIATIAGVGTVGSTGDGAAATSARLDRPWGLALDAQGNVFFADYGNDRVRMVCRDPTGCGALATGDIDTVAGGGTSGMGDGGPPTSAHLDGPVGVAVDAHGNIFIVDTSHDCEDRSYDRVHMICREPSGCDTIAYETIGTIAGGSLAGLGDGGPATGAQLNCPQGLALNGQGDLFIADTGNNRIRRVCRRATGCGAIAYGDIDTIAGGGAAGLGDGGPAASAQLNSPRDVAVDSQGNVLAADTSNQRIRKICMDPAGCGALASGNIDTIVGRGTYGKTGDFGPATSADLGSPFGVALDGAENILISELSSGRVRMICTQAGGCGALQQGEIATIAGLIYPVGDGAISQSALATPWSGAWTGNDLLVADGMSGRVRRVQLANGLVDTVAGYPGGFADGQDARSRAWLSRLLSVPFGIVTLGAAASPSVLVSERDGNTLRRVDLVDPADSESWTIATYAGALNVAGYADGPIDLALFAKPAGMAVDSANGYVYLADSGNHVIRRIDLDAQVVTTIAGIAGPGGDFGDGGLASAALFSQPQAVALDLRGGLYVADTGNNRVRRIDFSTGTIDSVLGDGTASAAGEGAPARFFPVVGPQGLAIDRFDNLFVPSTYAIREVVAGADGLATGEDQVLTIYGKPPREDFPESATLCLSGLTFAPASSDDATLFVFDACQGYLLKLERHQL
jgi:sugar lactone lactonase YvrE